MPASVTTGYDQHFSEITQTRRILSLFIASLFSVIDNNTNISKVDYATYKYSNDRNPKLVATCLLDPLSAQKHFLLESLLKFEGMPLSQRKTLKALGKLELNACPLTTEVFELIGSAEGVKFLVFAKKFRGRKPIDKISSWITVILNNFKSKKLCVALTQFMDELITLEEGKRLRSEMSFDRPDSPIILRTKAKDKALVYIYLMLIDADIA